MPDCGFFLDYIDVRYNTSAYRNSFINFMNYSNAEVDPIQSQCVADFPNDKWKCLFAEYLVNYIEVPFFFI